MKPSFFFPYREYTRYAAFNQPDDSDKVTQIAVGSDIALMFNHTVNRFADQGFTIQHGNGHTSEGKGKKAFKRALTSHLALTIWERKVGHFGLDLPIYNSENTGLLSNLQGGVFPSSNKRTIQVVMPEFAGDVFDEPLREHRVFSFRFAYEYSLVVWLMRSNYHSQGLTESLNTRLMSADAEIDFALARIRELVGRGE